MPPKARRHPAFLKALSRHGVASVAADAADLDLDELEALRETDPDFDRAWTNAVRLSRDRLIAVAYDRAIDGLRRPLHAAGKLTVDAEGKPVLIAEHDTKLLLVLLENLAGLKEPRADPRAVASMPSVNVYVEKGEGEWERVEPGSLEPG